MGSLNQSVDEESLKGDNLRTKRNQFNENSFCTPTAALIGVASCIAISIANRSKDKTSEQSKSNELSSDLSDTVALVRKRLKATGFRLSRSQPDTPSDGNCQFWSLIFHRKLYKIIKK